ncbi:MAG: hypothetical protein ACRDNO_26460 [Trebonia sp.]
MRGGPACAVRPLLARGRLVTVDSHPVCADCGVAVAPGAADRWKHVPAGQPYPRRSRWFAAVTWAALRELRSYQEFRERFPWTVRSELCGGAVTSEGDWSEGMRRLREYHGLLAAARRRRVLGAGENPYLELTRVLAGATTVPAALPAQSPGWSSRGPARGRALDWTAAGGVGHVLGLPARRRELAALFAWAIPDEGALAVLARHGPLLECGAGTGYWAALLRARGVDVLASDLAPPGIPADHATGDTEGVATASDAAYPTGRSPAGNRYHGSGRRAWTEVQVADAVDAVRAARASGRTLFLGWPPFDDDAASYAALRAYRGDSFIYAGGALGGPTGTVRFHRELELNWHPAEQAALPNWPGLRDRLVVYRRNPVRRPLSRRDRCQGCRRFLPTGAIGRCDACFARKPPAMALLVNGQRVEYPREVVDAMPRGLRLAFERSPALIPVSPRD